MFGKKKKKKNKKIGRENFRNIFDEIIYIKPDRKTKKLLKDMRKVLGKGKGFLAYGYIDDESGFAFRLLCSATLNKEVLKVGEFDENAFLAVHRRVFDMCEFWKIEEYEFDKRPFLKEINTIKNTYKCEDPEIEKIRELEIMDDFRSREHPDDVKVELYKDGIGVELAWVRYIDGGKREFRGRLINEPYKNFGVHKGDIIEFSIVKSEGEFVSIALV